MLETDDFQYLLMDGASYGLDELEKMHETFARNLPSTMKLIVVTEASYAREVETQFRQWIDADRLIIASGQNLGDKMWARDSYPYPVYKSAAKDVQLVAHEYFRYFNAFDAISAAAHAKDVLRQGFVYVGGNLTATDRGDCFIVNSSRAFGLGDSEFLNVFRCKTITRLPYLAGIGDVDEVLKTLPGGIILTNQEQYRAQLEGMGYQVILLPKANGSYRTYANSVILGRTVFMPFYSSHEDSQAIQIYESLGYRVVPISSQILSDEEHGSLHCLTMAYPRMDLKQLIRGLGLEMN